MPLASLKDVLKPAFENGYAVAGLVCLGWEDARAYVTAANEERVPVILQAGPGCRAHTPLPVLSAMFRALAQDSDVPVVAHLDHGYTNEECKQAIDCGFTSVMFDGSRKPLNQNIEETAAIAEIARAAGVSLEGEVGFVGYAEGEASAGTSVEEAAAFSSQSGADAMAISVGNMHLQQEKAAVIDRNLLNAIQEQSHLPLVIHGGSGVPSDVRLDLAQNTHICKFNIGTELRMAFGNALRLAVNKDPERFDRAVILSETEPAVAKAARQVLCDLGYPGRT